MNFPQSVALIALLIFSYLAWDTWTDWNAYAPNYIRIYRRQRLMLLSGLAAVFLTSITV